MVRVIERILAGYVLREMGKDDGCNNRTEFLGSAQGQVLVKDFNTFIETWVEQAKRMPEEKPNMRSTKLGDFRIETYAERTALLWALMTADVPEDHRRAIQGLRLRLARIQCQEGGCSICGEGDEE